MQGTGQFTTFFALFLLDEVFNPHGVSVTRLQFSFRVSFSHLCKNNEHQNRTLCNDPIVDYADATALTYAVTPMFTIDSFMDLR